MNKNTMARETVKVEKAVTAEREETLTILMTPMMTREEAVMVEEAEEILMIPMMTRLNLVTLWNSWSKEKSN